MTGPEIPLAMILLSLTFSSFILT